MSKIKFVRTYTFYGHDYYDVLYTSNRLYTGAMDCIPKTVKNFIENANRKIKQYDQLYKRWETIHEIKTLTCGGTGMECKCLPDENGQMPCKTCEHGQKWQNVPNPITDWD